MVTAPILVFPDWSKEFHVHVDLFIVDLPPPTSVRQLRTALGHTGYYRNFIKGYAQITTPMEKLLNKYSQFQWSKECLQSFDTLK